MSQAIALVRRQSIDALEVVRVALVAACGCALIAAGQVLPL